MKVIGDGSVVQRDMDKSRSRCRKWELSVMTVDESGRRRRKTRMVNGTYTQAQSALGEFVLELSDEPEPSDHTFASYAALWHQRRVDAGQCHNSRVNEERRIERLCELIGDMPLESIGVVEIEDAYDALRAMGYAETTVALSHSTLAGVLRDAYRRGVLDSIPLDRVRVPSGRYREKRVLSDAEMDALLERLDLSDGKEMGVALCVACGLRRAEVVALRWRDFDGSAISVHQADDGAGEVKRPKTDASMRTVPVPSSLASRMEALHGKPGDWMCPNRDGGYMTARSFGQWWADYRHRYGVDVSLHELRHSYLTRLARAGVHPRVMQSLAGHSSMRVTMEIYTHVSLDMERDAVDAAFS